MNDPIREIAPDNATFRVLLVEDHELVREIVADNLQTLGYSVLTAADGVEGLRRIEAEKGNLDLVISDVSMPKMGGRALARRLSSLYPDLPIVLISGYTETDAATLGSLPGVVGLLQKPVTLADLALTVSDALKARRNGDREPPNIPSAR